MSFKTRVEKLETSLNLDCAEHLAVVVRKDA